MQARLLKKTNTLNFGSKIASDTMNKTKRYESQAFFQCSIPVDPCYRQQLRSVGSWQRALPVPSTGHGQLLPSEVLRTSKVLCTTGSLL